MVLLRPCSTSAGFTATPEAQRRVDMGALKAALLDAGFEVLLDAKIILLVRKGVEASVYDTGKVLLKTTKRSEAEASYAELRPLLEAAWA